MKIILVLAAALALTACESEQSAARRNKIDAELTTNGYAVVGKTPSGKPLLMMNVYSRGEMAYPDRVYFVDDDITAVENCGKSCEKSVTSHGKL